jgi:hypothetical protein
VLLYARDFFNLVLLTFYAHIISAIKKADAGLEEVTVKTKNDDRRGISIHNE